MRPNVFSIFLIVVSLGGVAFASDWKREINGRWGFALTYPASLIPEPTPSDGAGRRYHSVDNSASLAVMGSHTHPEEFLDNFWQKELNTRGETVIYKFKKDSSKSLTRTRNTPFTTFGWNASRAILFPLFRITVNTTDRKLSELDYISCLDSADLSSCDWPAAFAEIAFEVYCPL